MNGWKSTARAFVLRVQIALSFLIQMIDIAKDCLKPLCRSHNIINYAANTRWCFKYVTVMINSETNHG